MSFGRDNDGGPILIEGYASLFGVEDLAGDVVRAGAFSRSLARERSPGMLLLHVGGRTAGRWTTLREDGRGLFVRGLVSADAPAGRAAIRLIAEHGLDGLSIGFLARDWRPRVAPGSGRAGRELIQIDLREISLVASPMLTQARFKVLGNSVNSLRNVSSA